MNSPPKPTAAPSLLSVPGRGAAQHRQDSFCEPLVRRGQRLVLACAYLLLPKRIAQLPALTGAVMRSWWRGGIEQPTLADVHAAPAGFAGLVRKPSPANLLAAHRIGLFPQAHMGPLQWWTREERYVQFLSERRMPKTLRNEMRKARLTITFDQAFDAVIAACAEPRPGRPKLTWITPKIMRLYSQMHAMGDAHSVEVWDETGTLVGGGYGVAIGRIFVTESLFSRTSSASKMAMQALNFHLHAWGFILNDVKDFAPHMSGMGSRHISGAEYAALLGQFAKASLPASAAGVPWRPHALLGEIVAASVPSQAVNTENQRVQESKPKLQKMRPLPSGMMPSGSMGARSGAPKPGSQD